MIETFYPKHEEETSDEYLVRLGNLKETKQINLTWDEMALIMNNSLQPNHPMTESYWRKKYHKLIENNTEVKSVPDSRDNHIKSLFNDIEKQRVRLHDERTSYNRMIRSQARQDEILQLFKSEIHKYDNHIPRVQKEEASEQAVYALLSDIHYGISFSSITGKYNSEIAKQRVYKYASKIIDIGYDCDTCYVSLMGDLVSGTIHQAIRIENKENIIQQIIGVSELVAGFLYLLSEYFKHVYVNSVDGNHSRIDPNLENVLRTERYDSLIPWYCKTKLEDVDNVHFVENIIDPSIGSFNIFGKCYLSVHGDLEKDLKTSANNIEKSLGHHIDYMLAAHTHIAEMRMEDTMYIRNGCVCGSGDDYTMKKRLYGPASQVCLLCSEQGVDSIHPVAL